MATEIKGVTFFQKGLVYEKEQFSKRFDFAPETGKMLKDHKIFTRFMSADIRFKLNERLHVARNVSVEPYTIFASGGYFFSMGAFSYSQSNLPIHTIIGRYSVISGAVREMGPNHPMNRFTSSILTYDPHNAALNTYKEDFNAHIEPVRSDVTREYPIIIGNDVWIGENVTFSSKGIVVNDGAVIGADSVVTKDVPPYAVVVGVPAHVIKYRFDPDTIKRLMALKWWQYDFGQFTNIKVDDPIDKFLDEVESLQAAGKLKPYEPEIVTMADFDRLEEK
ncbi:MULTISPECIES: CatB-related O-acetyltransferase [Levilactobacillus]|uniref:CatB-related O-acetyltransferase n=1 Tax=Levilactobacillus tongjiangensis TaxID=2486023 RepID=A0ABW1SP10_9LACO|nr:CatB-related O-acetyltransferase [Levilactobacillus tongjiangensis]